MPQGGDGLAKRLGRWARQSPFVLALGGHAGALYIRLVMATTRWDVRGREHFDKAIARKGGVIGATWHGRLCLAPYWMPPGRRTVGMISANRDGELITRILARFGVEAVRGSSYDKVKGRDKGGARALVEAEAELAWGSVLVITPDGPRGPRMRVQPGTAQLSIRTRAPVFPMTYAVRRGRELKSWDRFLLPYPFGRGVQIMGAPLMPPKDMSAEAVEAFRVQIETALISLAREADIACGRTPVEPA